MKINTYFSKKLAKTLTSTTSARAGLASTSNSFHWNFHRYVWRLEIWRKKIKVQTFKSMNDQLKFTYRKFWRTHYGNKSKQKEQKDESFEEPSKIFGMKYEDQLQFQEHINQHMQFYLYWSTDFYLDSYIYFLLTTKFDIHRFLHDIVSQEIYTMHEYLKFWTIENRLIDSWCIQVRRREFHQRFVHNYIFFLIRLCII